MFSSITHSTHKCFLDNFVQNADQMQTNTVKSERQPRRIAGILMNIYVMRDVFKQVTSPLLLASVWLLMRFWRTQNNTNWGVRHLQYNFPRILPATGNDFPFRRIPLPCPESIRSPLPIRRRTKFRRSSRRNRYFAEDCKRLSSNNHTIQMQHRVILSVVYLSPLRSSIARLSTYSSKGKVSFCR